MSYFDGIGGKFNRVPATGGARNHALQTQNTMSGVIKSARWEQTETATGQSVPFIITLGRLAITKSAIVEIFFHQPGLPPQVIGTPLILPAAGLVIQGRWTSIVPGPRKTGHFRFRVRVDNQSMISNELRSINDPVEAAMRRNYSDGFDR